MSTTTVEPGAVAAERPEPIRRRRDRPSVIVAGAWIVVLAAFACAVLGDVVAPKDPDVQTLAARALAPGDGYLLGTDGLGRDVLSRVIVGARAAIVGPVLVALGALVVGSVVGIAAGYLGGWVDAMAMRAADFVFAVPHLLVVLVIGGVVGGGYAVAVALLALFLAPHVARLVRGAVLQQRELPYVEAARALGVSQSRIMRVHLWPNVAPVAVSTAFLFFAVALVALSSLSFLGVGVGPGTPDWGRMLVENRELLEANPWAALAPGLAIVLTACAMNVLGDWLFERLTAEERD
jgi:peptide/nickel transport system permease protein